jgi:hypothetical protein
MQDKRKIEAKSLVNDIRAGLNNRELMEKYGLSSKGLLSAFNKLVASRVMTEEEVAGRIPSFDDTVDIDHAREIPRCYPALGIPIYDQENTEVEYHVLDLTEKGVQVVGMEVEVGTAKALSIRVGDIDRSIPSCSFQAECRWVKADHKNRHTVAGFEITNISGNDAETLTRIIKLLTFCDE